MILMLQAEKVTTWFVAFHRSTGRAWFDRLVPGRFKHVSAFGYSAGCKMWVFYDVSLFGGTSIILAPEGPQADQLMGQVTEGSDVVLKLAEQPRSGRIGFAWLFFWCVPAIRNLLGVPGGALVPSSFLTECVSAGAETIISHEFQHAPAPA